MELDAEAGSSDGVVILRLVPSEAGSSDGVVMLRLVPLMEL